MTTPDEPGERTDETIDTSADPKPAGIPAKIGQYAIKRVIASGGMGTVYEAQQENPRRPAAVKVVKRSMASTEGLRRFEREAQALARLRHPGIAQIYEAGTFEEGGESVPFFAMEYIPNARTLIEFANAKNYDTRQRLELFMQVCEAVHFGHQRGIIHRDLKPGNILVDSEGRVRIIDFGVARAVDADMEQADFQTQVGQIVGTAQYMSPEQFEADPNDLDTRSDIYALGVVLFELLSGRLPYAIETSGVFEIARIVREDPPATLGSVVPGIDGEIELITAKALNKDRDLRYQSAFGLGQDIQHHLKGEAISAKTTSVSYQAKVFARKNKAVVGLAASVAVLLVVGIAWTSKLYVDVNAERARAETAATQAIAANTFLTESLRAVVPPGFGDVRTIGDLCDQVAQDIDGAFPDSPTTEADVRHTIGQIYGRIDRRDQAENQLRKAYLLREEHLGPEDDLTLQALSDLNYHYYVFGPMDQYLETAEQYLELVEKKYGPDHDTTLTARMSVASGYDHLGDYSAATREARTVCDLAGLKWGEHSLDAMYYTADLARFQLNNGQLEEAVVSAQMAYEQVQKNEDRTSLDTTVAKNTYGAALVASGRIDQAKELYGHKKAPDPLGTPFGSRETILDAEKDLRVLVFFETWCPYSQRYMPTVESLNRQYRDLGVEVIGVTAVSRSSSDNNVRQFIVDNELTFDVLKENGRTSNYFEISGVPQTVLLHEGEVIWVSRGAGWLNNRILEGVLSAN